MRFAEHRSVSLFKQPQSSLQTAQSLKKAKTSSLKSLRLPSIEMKSQKKTYFKAVQEMGNSLKSNFLYDFSDGAIIKRTKGTLGQTWDSYECKIDGY